MSKAVDFAEDLVKSPGKGIVKIGKALTEPIKDTLVGAREDLQSFNKLLSGDYKGAQEKFVGARSKMAEGGGGTMVPLAEITAPEVPKLLGIASGTINTATTTWSLSKAGQYAYDRTGGEIDLTGVAAKEKKRAAQAAYEAEVKAANEAAERNRRANLLSLRKALTPSLSRSSQGGGGAGYFDEKKQGGITLG